MFPGSRGRNSVKPWFLVLPVLALLLFESVGAGSWPRHLVSVGVFSERLHRLPGLFIPYLAAHFFAYLQIVFPIEVQQVLARFRQGFLQPPDRGL